MRTSITAALTLTFGVGVALAGTHTSPAAPMHTMKKPAGGAAVIAQGKALAESNGCNGCHAANYGGKKGFSPSIRATGSLREYNVKTFERVMDTGVTNDGGRVRKPMPVYHMTAKKSAPLYAFLKTLK